MTTKSAENNPTHWPKVGASFALLRGDTVLLVERSKPPRGGLWSFPGGHVEAGETACAAAMRELEEETGLVADAVGLVDVLDVIMRDAAGALRAHYLLTVYWGHWQSGEPQAASDARDARFVPFSALDEYPLTPDAKRIIAKASALRDAG